jgi:hemerythrin superfamily protein
VSDQDHDRAEAAQLPEGDLVAILLTQHATVRDLLEQVSGSSGQDRKQAFDRLAGLLKAHETAEESVVRPESEQTAGADIVRARNAEEDEADEVIAKLQQLDVDSADFDSQFAEFSKAVSEHAEAEERDEFPTIRDGRSPADRIALGERFLAEFRAAGGTA